MPELEDVKVGSRMKINRWKKYKSLESHYVLKSSQSSFTNEIFNDNMNKIHLNFMLLTNAYGDSGNCKKITSLMSWWFYGKENSNSKGKARCKSSW